MDSRAAQPVPPIAPTPTLSAATVEEVKKLVKQYTTRQPTDTEDPLPGVIFNVVDRFGKTLVCATAGPRDITVPEVSVDSETILFMGSLTKLVTVIATLMLVERGLIGLDDWEALYKLVPELAEKMILKGFDAEEEPILEKVPESAPKISLRLLLANISGFGTTFFSEKLWEYYEKDIWHDDIWGGWESMVKMPLIDAPGEKWNYGVSFGDGDYRIPQFTRTDMEPRLE